MLRKEYTIYILYVFKSKLNLRNTLRKKSYKKLWHFFLSVRKNDVYFYTEAEIINLSRSWNLSVGWNKVEIVLQFSRFKPAFNWNRFLWDLRRGLNSLNSDTDYFTTLRYFDFNTFLFPIEGQILVEILSN